MWPQRDAGHLERGDPVDGFLLPGTGGDKPVPESSKLLDLALWSRGKFLCLWWPDGRSERQSALAPVFWNGGTCPLRVDLQTSPLSEGSLGIWYGRHMRVVIAGGRVREGGRACWPWGHRT